MLFRSPDHRYGSHQVAAVDHDQQGGGYNQRPKNDGPSWGENHDNRRQGVEKNKPTYESARYTYEKMLDGPCRYHTTNPRRPANHSTRQCSWYDCTVRDAVAGKNNPPQPRYPPKAPPRPALQLTGANADGVGDSQVMKPAGTWQDNVNMVIGPAPIINKKTPATSTTRISTRTMLGRVAKMSTKSIIRATWCLLPSQLTSRAYTSAIWR